MASGTDTSRAQLARSAIAFAQVATVCAVELSGQRGPLTTARTACTDNGDLLLRIDGNSPVAIRFAAAPDAAVTVVAPAPYAVVQLTGLARLTPECEGSAGSGPGGHRDYRMTITSVRLVGAADSADSAEVPLAEYWAAGEDPIASHAPGMLAHLTQAHAQELLAAVRAHVEPTAEMVVPRSLDSFGLRLTVVLPSGVREINMAFPGGPARSIREVAAHLRAALSCPCSRRELRSQTDS